MLVHGTEEVELVLAETFPSTIDRPSMYVTARERGAVWSAQLFVPLAVDTNTSFLFLVLSLSSSLLQFTHHGI